MYVKIQTSSKANGNKGSCTAMATYLEKEDMDKEFKRLQQGELPEKKQGFFSHKEDNITKGEVIQSIDNNKKALGKNDAKFYSITISPTEKEQLHILNDIVVDREVFSITDLTKDERELFEERLKEFSRATMDEYAKNFERKGLDDGEQLLYFGKVEHQRQFKGTDIEVKRNEVKSGDLKPGFQSHVHIIVSRKDKEQRLKLSPLANERAGKSNSKLNGKNVQRGFDRVKFKITTEKKFDEMFNFKRQHQEKTKTMIDNKKGNISIVKNPKKLENSNNKELDYVINDLSEQKRNTIMNNYKGAETKEEQKEFTRKQKQMRLGREYKKAIDTKVEIMKATQGDLYIEPNIFELIDYEKFEKEFEAKIPTNTLDFEI